MRAPFSFLKPTGHSEKKATDALAHDPGCPPLKTKRKKKRTPSPQIKTNSEPHKMASAVAPPAPQGVTVDGKDERSQACYFSAKYKCENLEHNFTRREEQTNGRVGNVVFLTLVNRFIVNQHLEPEGCRPQPLLQVVGLYSL